MNEGGHCGWGDGAVEVGDDVTQEKRDKRHGTSVYQGSQSREEEEQDVAFGRGVGY